MLRKWKKKDLEKYLKYFGSKALIRLLAVRGDVYVSKRERGGWIIYPTRVDEDLLPTSVQEKYFPYGSWLAELNHRLNKKDMKASGDTYLFNRDGSLDCNVKGVIEYDEKGKVKLHNDRIDLKGNPWRSPFAVPFPYLVNPELDIFSEPQFFLLPGVVYLEARPTEDRLVRILKTDLVAGIYQIPTDAGPCYNPMTGEHYYRMGCVVAKTKEDILQYLYTHINDWDKVVALFEKPLLPCDKDKPRRIWDFYYKGEDNKIELRNCCISYKEIREETEDWAIRYQIQLREDKALPIINLVTGKR